MSQVIAGIYEIDRPIGAGGVGTAYLGWHLRLNKGSGAFGWFSGS